MRGWTHWIILNVLIVLYVLIGLLTLIFQIDTRECDSNCGISYAKSVIWSAIWRASWVVYFAPLVTSKSTKPNYGPCGP